MEQIKSLMNFLDSSHSVYHAVACLEQMLTAAGYTCLQESEDWMLIPGGKYYFTRSGSALMAFRIPQVPVQGFLMSGSHADRPTFKIKGNGELVGSYTRLSTEKYGGMLMSSWMDRPLSVAGRVLVDDGEQITLRLVDIDRDLLLIPNVAIHMNRNANDGYSWNPAVDTIPLLGGKEAKGGLRKLLRETVGGHILGHDLYLYVRQKATVWGLNEEFLSAPALDDLACVWGCCQGFLNAREGAYLPVLCVFDSEEVGSNSPQGAASTILTDTLERICAGADLDLKRLLAGSFMVSADNAHAVHPNHPEYADPQNAPVMGGGVVLKFNAAQRYATDGVSAAVFRKLCDTAGLNLQTYYNRADIPGGSTLGHISLNHVSVPTADIGLAQLAMHSSYETAGVQDVLDLEQIMTAYYSGIPKIGS